MSPLLRSILTFACVGSATASGLAAQDRVPRVQLPGADAEAPEPFDAISSVRELGDGRVLVADVLGKTVSLVDFRRGSQTAVGREGQGPNEYAFPVGLIPLPGDSTLLIDMVQRRFLRITPGGKPAGTIPFPGGRFAEFRGADAQGRLYFQGSPVSAALGERPNLNFDGAIADTVPLVRWDRKARYDTLGMVNLPATRLQVSNSGDSRTVMRRPAPYSAGDDWAVARDGWVGIARADGYRVDWLGGPRPVQGAKVAFEKVPVSKADKDEFIERMSDRRGMVVVSVGGGNGPRPPLPSADDFEFPEFKPPFVSRTARVAPDGALWVQRSQPHGGPTLYDVFDRQGRLVRQVVLPKGSRVVGFGASAVYVGRTDEDELVWLSRHRLP